MKDDGYATLWTAIALAVLAILAASVAALPIRTSAEMTAFRKGMESEAVLTAALAETIAALGRDQSHQSDAPGDPLWSRLREGFDGGVDVTVKDISSAVNPNAVSLELLNDSELRTKFRYFTAPAEWKRRIASEGFAASPEELEDFLPESSMETFFTVYGLWNPAVSDQISLERLIAERTGPAAAEAETEAPAAALASALIEAGGGPADAALADYTKILGTAAAAVCPLITNEPLINVHYADAELLRIILNMNYGGKPLPDPAGALARITAVRLGGEIMPSALRHIIAVEDGQEAVFEILGTTTWFWEIAAASEEDVLVAVLARVPAAVEGDRPSFQIVSRRFGRKDG